jgi:hypothetical protein
MTVISRDVIAMSQAPIASVKQDVVTGAAFAVSKAQAIERACADASATLRLRSLSVTILFFGHLTLANSPHPSARRNGDDPPRPSFSRLLVLSFESSHIFGAGAIHGGPRPHLLVRHSPSPATCTFRT